MTPSNIPAAWREVLSLVQTVAPTAILAGGALRDLDNDRKVKDLDVFVPHGTSDSALMKAVEKFYPNLDHFIAEEYLENLEDVSSVMLLSSTADKLPPLNIIFGLPGADPKDRIETFDFGLCQIAFDGTRVITTPAYCIDKANATLTLVNCKSRTAFELSFVRYQRLLEKYPSWPLSMLARIAPLTVEDGVGLVKSRSSVDL